VGAARPRTHASRLQRLCLGRIGVGALHRVLGRSPRGRPAARLLGAQLLALRCSPSPGLSPRGGLRTGGLTQLNASPLELFTGDGAGILAAMPDSFFGTTMEAQGVRLPPVGQYAVGQVFLPKVNAGGGRGGGGVAVKGVEALGNPPPRLKHPDEALLRLNTILACTRTPLPLPLKQDEQQRDIAKRVMDAVAAELGHDVLAWRDVPTDNRSLGASAVKVEPVIQQWFITADGAKHRQLDAEGQVCPWRRGVARAPWQPTQSWRVIHAGPGPQTCHQRPLVPSCVKPPRPPHPFPPAVRAAQDD
jgi:hypothetical protein